MVDLRLKLGQLQRGGLQSSRFQLLKRELCPRESFASRGFCLERILPREDSCLERFLPSRGFFPSRRFWQRKDFSRANSEFNLQVLGCQSSPLQGSKHGFRRGKIIASSNWQKLVLPARVFQQVEEEEKSKHEDHSFLGCQARSEQINKKLGAKGRYCNKTDMQGLAIQATDQANMHKDRKSVV